MACPLAAAVPYLHAARTAVADDRIRSNLLDPPEERFADLHGDVVCIPLESIVARHAAAACREFLYAQLREVLYRTGAATMT